MTKKILMKNGYLLSVHDDSTVAPNHIADVVYGEVITDDALRFPVGYRVVTSIITDKSSDFKEFHTKSGSVYELIRPALLLGISFKEWQQMREQTISPDELLTLRGAAKFLALDINNLKPN